MFVIIKVQIHIYPYFNKVNLKLLHFLFWWLYPKCFKIYQAIYYKLFKSKKIKNHKPTK